MPVSMEAVVVPDGLREVTAADVAEDDSDSVFAVFEESTDRAWIVRANPAGELRIVAEVSPDLGTDGDASMRVRFVLWDRAGGVAFVGGEFGCLAFGTQAAERREAVVVPQ